jgi:hypothetical protein
MLENAIVTAPRIAQIRTLRSVDNRRSTAASVRDD